VLYKNSLDVYGLQKQHAVAYKKCEKTKAEFAEEEGSLLWTIKKL